MGDFIDYLHQNRLNVCQWFHLLNCSVNSVAQNGPIVLNSIKQHFLGVFFLIVSTESILNWRCFVIWFDFRSIYALIQKFKFLRIKSEQFLCIDFTRSPLKNVFHHLRIEVWNGFPMKIFYKMHSTILLLFQKINKLFWSWQFLWDFKLLADVLPLECAKTLDRKVFEKEFFWIMDAMCQ